MTETPAQNPSFQLGPARHFVGDAGCSACDGRPSPCGHPGCRGHRHAFRLRLGAQEYLVTQCDACLLP